MPKKAGRRPHKGGQPAPRPLPRRTEGPFTSPNFPLCGSNLWEFRNTRPGLAAPTTITSSARGLTPLLENIHGRDAPLGGQDAPPQQNRQNAVGTGIQLRNRLKTGHRHGNLNGREEAARLREQPHSRPPEGSLADGSSRGLLPNPRVGASG